VPQEAEIEYEEVPETVDDRTLTLRTKRDKTRTIKTLQRFRQTILHTKLVRQETFHKTKQLSKIEDKDKEILR
jgi:hypothetical protein